MCRVAAYMGPEISLEHFLLKPEHGLTIQSYAPYELTEAKVNVDGYGFGWFAHDDAPAIYTSSLPIWADHNLPPLARSMFSDHWVAAVRSATVPMANHPANTQPFADEEMLFLHNGFISDFNRSMRRTLREHLEPGIESQIRGNTDSEYLFALLRQALVADQEMPIVDGMRHTFGLLQEWSGEDLQILLNVIIADGENIYACRHAINKACPSLYYTSDDEQYPDGVLIASEPMTHSGLWQQIPEHQILIVEKDQPPQLAAL